MHAVSKLGTFFSVGQVMLGALLLVQNSAAAEPETEGNAMPPEGGSGTSTSTIDSVWTIAADARLDSITLNEPGASFGLGLGFRTQRWEVRTIIRHSADGQASDVAAGSRAAGMLVLSPGTAKIGATTEITAYINSGRWCTVLSAHKAKEGIARCGPNPTFTQSVQGGLGFILNVGQTDLHVTNEATGTETETTIVPVHLALGAAGRIFGEFEMNGTRYPIALNAFLGPSLRVASGDMTDATRTEVLGSDRETYWGLDLHLRAQIASATVGMALSYIPKGDVSGLSEAQLSPYVTFSLPLSIVSRK